jgi:hypothetical protein
VRALHLLIALACALIALPTDALAAYTQGTVTYVRQKVDGQPCQIVTYTETEVGANSEATINVDYRYGVIVSIKQDLTAGTGATLNTKIGRAATFTVSTQDHVLSATATADPISEQGESHFYASGSKLYVRASPNAGSDNSVATEIIICAGAP